MKIFTAVLGVLVFCAACAHGPEAHREAYRTDQGYSQAQQASWAQLVAYPEGRQPEAVPEGLEGTAAHEAHKIYVKTFAEKPVQEPVFQLGVVGGK
jgi:hypothetical protein